jgi:hypothetical protein
MNVFGVVWQGRPAVRQILVQRFEAVTSVAPSSSPMMFCRASILACAMLPRISCDHSRRSKGSDWLNRQTSASVSPSNRPPHKAAVIGL